jgi:thiamine transport system substrate-binding protein
MLKKIFKGVVLLWVATLLVACAAPSATLTVNTPESSPQAVPTAAPIQPTEAQPTSLPATATAAPTGNESGAAVTLTVLTHDSFAISDPLVKQFEQDNHVHISFIKGGDAGAALNKAILSKENPQADVFYGVDNTFISRALKSDIFEPYNSPALKTNKAEFDLDSQHRLLPVDYGDVCINYDKAYFKTKNLPIPATLDDLTRSEYKGQLVVENPATSSTGLAFMLATVAEYGPDHFLDYWKKLKANDVMIVDGWEAAYYTQFSGSSGKGPQSMVVSYGTSPAAEVVFAKEPMKDAPTASIVGANTCFRQIEFVGILKGTQQQALAEKWVDFMLSKSFQEDMPLQMFVFPVNPQAALPDAFKKYIQVPDKPASVSPEVIDSNRDSWIEAWRTVMLQ